jgi:DNA-binding PadR family transcriptional regulator
VTFHILVALEGEKMHGSAIQRNIADRTGGAVRVDNSTLYRSMHRMVERGLVSESGARPEGGPADERRRYYHITQLGREVARAEATRLTQAVALAREKGLVAEN